MTDQEKLNNWVDNHDIEEYCKYCVYKNTCAYGMACYGGDPVEPPCASKDVWKILDIDEILEAIEEEEKDELV